MVINAAAKGITKHIPMMKIEIASLSTFIAPQRHSRGAIGAAGAILASGPTGAADVNYEFPTPSRLKLRFSRVSPFTNISNEC